MQHVWNGELFTVLVGAVRHDKHPDPAKRRPRPFWACIDALDGDDPGSLRRAFVAAPQSDM